MTWEQILAIALGDCALTLPSPKGRGFSGPVQGLPEGSARALKYSGQHCGLGR